MNNERYLTEKNDKSATEMLIDLISEETENVSAVPSLSQMRQFT